MAKDRTPQTKKPVTHTLTVTFSVDARPGEHLQSDEAIRSEIHSWLEGLDATVHTVTLDEPAP